MSLSRKFDSTSLNFSWQMNSELLIEKWLVKEFFSTRMTKCNSSILITNLVSVSNKRFPLISC